MALFNYATKEITLKIVYYGPGLSGKTTNIQHLHSALTPEKKGKLLSLSTETDRTLFFDFLPVELGKIKDFSIRFQLYTVPGQVRYNATRKVVLKGADAVVFVADSQQDMREQNIESFENMRENLVSNNIKPDEIPVVLQFNKRDLGNILTVDELNNDLNKNKAYDIVEAEAINGNGVEATFQLITRLLLKDIARKHNIEIQPAQAKEETGKEDVVSEIGKQEIRSAQLFPESEVVGPAGYAFEKLTKLEPEFALPKESAEIIEQFEPEQETHLTAELEPEKEVQQEPAREVRVMPDIYAEKTKAIAADIIKLNAAILDLKGTAASLKADITAIKNNVNSILENTAPREDEHIKELIKEHKALRVILKDISAALSEPKKKKRWFPL
jgi:signal recognition particle receptor subunit beta